MNLCLLLEELTSVASDLLLIESHNLVIAFRVWPIDHVGRVIDSVQSKVLICNLISSRIYVIHLLLRVTELPVHDAAQVINLLLEVRVLNHSHQVLHGLKILLVLLALREKGLQLLLELLLEAFECPPIRSSRGTIDLLAALVLLALIFYSVDSVLDPNQILQYDLGCFLDLGNLLQALNLLALVTQHSLLKLLDAFPQGLKPALEMLQLSLDLLQAIEPCFDGLDLSLYPLELLAVLHYDALIIQRRLEIEGVGGPRFCNMYV